jgi:trehalose/maltose hydrolase-like predicted phosphorylase
MTDNSHRQHHVGLAVAYNVWQYYQATADREFLIDHGAELLIEIARFWASMATHDPADDRYDIRGVMGPDEFHDGYPGRAGEGIDNNAYTNVMVSWLLTRVLEVHDLLSRYQCGDLWDRLRLGPDELDHWDAVSRKLRVPFHADGIISQFEGYEALEELDWAGYRARYANIGRLDLILEAEGDTTNRYKLSKQADVLMLFYLFSSDELAVLLDRLGYAFDPSAIPAVIDYYLNRVSDGSSLSRVAHAWVLSRAQRDRSWALFRDALSIDVDDTQDGTTQEGIHLGAMAGSIDLVQRCYTGLEVRDDVLWLNPRLPDHVGSLSFTLTYREQWVDVTITRDRITVHTRPSAAPPVKVNLCGETFELPGGAGAEHFLRPAPTSRGHPTAASWALASR